MENRATTLRDRFNAARYGHYFRTASFLNTVTGNREWLYAVQDPQARRCILMKVRENETGQERSKIKDGMAFLDALNHMSRFEHPDANPNVLPVHAGEKESLGDQHFQAFALKEGLIRDTCTGEFHPTLYGHVVTSGSFDPQELARAQAIAAGPQPVPERFIIPDHDGVLKAGESSIEMIARMHQGIAKLATVTELHHTLLKLADLYGQSYQTEESLHHRVGQVKSYDWHYTLEFNGEAAKEEFERAVKAYNSISLGKRVTRVYSALTNEGTDSFPAFMHNRIAEKLRATPPDHPDDIPAFERIMNLHMLVFEHSHCRSAYQYTLQYHSNEKLREKRLDIYKSSIKRLQKICQQLGFDDVETGTVKAHVYSREPLPYQAEITGFINTIKTVQAQCEQNITNEKAALAALIPSAKAPPKNQP